jgi:hypothetical protein
VFSNSDRTTLQAPELAPALVDRVRAEFEEAPGLSLTPAQAHRLFGLKPEVGAALLSLLCDTGFLMRDSTGRFRLRRLSD